MTTDKEATVEYQRKIFCDLTTARAAELMEESGAPVEMIVDRLVTYVAAQMVRSYGRQQAIDMFKLAAMKVEDGAFDQLIVN